MWNHARLVYIFAVVICVHNHLMSVNQVLLFPNCVSCCYVLSNSVPFFAFFAAKSQRPCSTEKCKKTPSNTKCTNQKTFLNKYLFATWELLCTSDAATRLERCEFRVSGAWVRAHVRLLVCVRPWATGQKGGTAGTGTVTTVTAVSNDSWCFVFVHHHQNLQRKNRIHVLMVHAELSQQAGVFRPSQHSSYITWQIEMGFLQKTAVNVENKREADVFTYEARGLSSDCALLSCLLQLLAVLVCPVQSLRDGKRRGDT